MGKRGPKEGHGGRPTRPIDPQQSFLGSFFTNRHANSNHQESNRHTESNSTNDPTEANRTNEPPQIHEEHDHPRDESRLNSNVEEHSTSAPLRRYGTRNAGIRTTFYSPEGVERTTREEQHFNLENISQSVVDTIANETTLTNDEANPESHVRNIPAAPAIQGTHVIVNPYSTSITNNSCNFSQAYNRP